MSNVFSHNVKLKITAKLCSDNHNFEMFIIISIFTLGSFCKGEQLNMPHEITWPILLSNQYLMPIPFQA